MRDDRAQSSRTAALLAIPQPLRRMGVLLAAKLPGPRGPISQSLCRTAVARVSEAAHFSGAAAGMEMSRRTVQSDEVLTADVLVVATAVRKPRPSPTSAAGKVYRRASGLWMGERSTAGEQR